jgi:hypothetical protein
MYFRFLDEDDHDHRPRACRNAGDNVPQLRSKGQEVGMLVSETESLNDGMPVGKL